MNEQETPVNLNRGSGISNSAYLPGLSLPNRLPNFIFTLFATYFWALISHAYGLLNGFYSHDVLNALMADPAEEVWKIQLGRFLVPVYRYIVRSNVTLTWLIGLIAFFYVACAVHLVVKLLNIRSRLSMFLIAGVFSVNLTVSALICTYIYELDFDMLAMLLATFAVFAWHKRKPFYYFLAVLALSSSLALYQAYYAFAAGLFLVVMASELMRSRAWHEVIKSGFTALAILLISGLLYALLLRLVSALTGIVLASGYNGLGSMFSEGFSLQVITSCYQNYFYQLVQLIPEYSQTLEIVLQSLISLCCLLKISLLFWQNKLKSKGLLLLFSILILLPLAVNGIYIISGGMVHQLMIYSFYVPLLLLFIEVKVDLKNFKNKKYRILYNGFRYGLVLLLIWGSIVSANVLYVKKDLETRAVYAKMTDLRSRISTQEGYIAGESEVALIGRMTLEYFDINPDYYMVAGSDMFSATPRHGHDFYNTYKTYYKYIFQEKIKLASLDRCYSLEEDPRFQVMEPYPAKDCVNIIDGVYVVKLSQ